MRRKTIRAILEGMLDVLGFTAFMMLRPKMQESGTPETAKWGKWLGTWKGGAVYAATVVVLSKQLPMLILPKTDKERKEEFEEHLVTTENARQSKECPLNSNARSWSDSIKKDQKEKGF